MAAREVREIIVKVDTPGEQGLKKISEGFGRMNRNIAQGTSILQRFEQAYFRIAGLSFAGLGLMTIIQSLDTFQKLNDRLKVTEGTAEGASLALRKVVEVAAITKSGVQDIAVVYTRLAQSMSELNLGTDAVLGLSMALQNSFRLSGATAAEANGAVIQLSQALSAGGLRGQELRSVMEANGLIAGILAKKLGIARGELIKWAEKNGGISTQTVLEALSENFEDLASKAEKMTPTVGEAMTMAFDKARLALHELNQEMGGTKAISETILFLGENFGLLAKSVAALGVAYVAMNTPKAIALTYSKLLLIQEGLLSAAYGIQMISVKGLTVLMWGYVASAKAALIALGPLGIALAAVGGAYALYRWEQEKTVKAHEKGLTLEEKRLRLHNQDYKAKMEKIEVEKAEKENLVQINQGTHDMIRLLAEQSGMTATVVQGVGVYRDALKEAAEKVKKNNEATFSYTDALKKLNEEFGTNGNVEEYKRRLKELDIAKLNQEFQKGEISLVKYKQALNEIMNGKSVSSLKAFRGELAEVNKQFELEVRTGNVSNYAQALQQVKLDKLNRDLKEGRTSFFEMSKQMREAQISSFNRELANGSIALDTYRASVQGIQLRQINEEWRAGITDIYEYNKAIVETQEKFSPNSAFFMGTANYIQQAGTLSQNVSAAVTNTFGRLEDAMVEFTTKGKFVFKDFAMAVLEDLNRMIMRAMILRPIANGLIGAFTGGAGASMESQNGLGASNPNLAAKGAYFSGKASYFAKGGVVDGATPFSYGGGRLGVMGEAGPEAIMPLRRTSSGDLGVQAIPSTPVIVNIHNNGGGEVEQKESKGPNGERILDIMISAKIKEAFANGTMDKQMSQNYGLRRKGI